MPEHPDECRRALVSLKARGTAVSQPVLDALTEARVEQSLHVPDAFTLRFNDHDLSLVAGPAFSLGDEVEVGVDSGGILTQLMVGEVTSLCAEIDGLSPQQFVVTGLDRRHRLARGVKVRTFVNQTDADAVRAIAGEHGLVLQADPTPTVHEYLLQCGTDYEFVSDRARRCGFDWWVAGRTLHFRRAAGPGARPKVRWGSSLRRFRLRLSSAESASEAEVRGWNPAAQQALVGTVAMKGPDGAGVGLATNAALVRQQVGKGPDRFPARRFAWGAPVHNGSEAEALATALAQRVTAEQAVARGEVLGDATLRPGVSIEVEGVADGLCGTYLLTRVEHVLVGGASYITRFDSGGAEDRTLIDLLGGQPHRANGSALPALGRSLVVGVITNNSDPDGLGRVKVKFPSLTDADESAWARVVSTGAGATRGLQVVPHVGDEVLVGFEHGDLRRPLVLGGLWSAANGNPRHATSGAKDGAVWQTRSGHLMTMSDGEAAPEQYVRVALHTGKTSLRLGADQSSLDVEQDLSIAGEATITINAKRDVTIEAASITLRARNRLVLEGTAGVEIKATAGPVQIQGLQAELKGQTQTSVDGGALTLIKGGAVKIN